MQPWGRIKSMEGQKVRRPSHLDIRRYDVELARPPTGAGTSYSGQRHRSGCIYGRRLATSTGFNYPSGPTSADVQWPRRKPSGNVQQRHDDQPRRKRHGEGAGQFGKGKGGEQGRGSGTRRVDNASNRRWAAGKSEFHEES
ncbi:hypothetical protein F5I97DRAFT_1356534 [Phlebopus sp. FC_14]|nr:hypothetical protein F5I97DRAFT_1356534 [Phlebopus sp. FC_14]